MIEKSVMNITYPSTRTTRHYLFEIDQVKKTAFCSACGWTKIHIPRTRTRQNSKILCIKRFLETKKTQNNRVSKKRRPKSEQKLQHVLSGIDAEKLRGVCSICGPTDLEKRTHKESTYYYCATNIRAKAGKGRRVKRSSNISSSTAHKLSQIDINNELAVCSVCGLVDIYVWRGTRKIDIYCSNAKFQKGSTAEEIRSEINIKLINDHKVTRGCTNCGYNKNPSKLCLGNLSPKKEETYIERLLRLHKKDLLSNLENCEVRCVNCR
jgi:hypothetical protein